MKVNFEIDNRDISTTELHAHGSDVTLEVNPWELVENVLENAGLTNRQLDDLVKKLEGIKKTAERLTHQDY